MENRIDSTWRATSAARSDRESSGGKTLVRQCTQVEASGHEYMYGMRRVRTGPNRCAIADRAFLPQWWVFWELVTAKDGMRARAFADCRS